MNNNNGTLSKDVQCVVNTVANTSGSLIKCQTMFPNA